jgi:glycosyltransferase involved in cell wall biosynthesis
MKKKILIITPRMPYPLFSGGEHAQFYFIGEMMSQMDLSICFEINESDYNSNMNDFLRLKEMWKDTTFFPLINKKKQSAAIIQYRRVKNGISGIKQAIFRIFSNQKHEDTDTLRYQSLVNQPFLTSKPAFADHIGSVLKSHHFDIIQIEFIALAPLVYILPPESLKVLVHHELRYIRIKREVDLLADRGHYDICRLEAIKDQEISLIRKFDKIITLTENDKVVLSTDIAPENIYVSPATVKVELNQNNEFSPFTNKLVFIGSSIHLPNKDGIKWFIDHVLPLIEKIIPDIQLDVAGSWDHKFIKEYTRRNVKFKGFVEDLSEVFESSLLIVPIRIGSGMRLKIIEAVNHMAPFITTSIGVEGLDFEDGKDCFIADTPQSFAEKIVRLSGDSAVQKELVNNASVRLKEKYSFESAIKRRLDFYRLLD